MDEGVGEGVGVGGGRYSREAIKSKGQEFEEMQFRSKFYFFL